MPSPKRIIRRLRNGTLLDGVRARLGLTPEFVRVHWFGARAAPEAARTLAHCARLWVAGDGSVLSLGDGGELHRRVNELLVRQGTPFRSHDLEAVIDWSEADAAGIKGILCSYTGTRRITEAARALAKHAAFENVPFESIAGLDRAHGVFHRLDEYAQTDFVAPSLLDSPSPYELYEESLRHFEQKCGLRDYLDLYQVIRHVVRSGVDGDVAEFGSFRGHSGYLIARTLQALGSEKRAHLFDMFESFPREAGGVDWFWNDSHYVNALDVSTKLSGLGNVRLIKGDFTKTLATSGLGKVSLAYVDCDSYRATRFLIDTLWQHHIEPGGALVCEDYGHPALLGSRAAVHEELDHRPDVFRFFSQFSGLYVALKLASAPR